MWGPAAAAWLPGRVCSAAGVAIFAIALDHHSEDPHVLSEIAIFASSPVLTSSSSSSSDTKPEGIAMTSRVDSSSSASQQKARNFSKPDAIVKVATLSFFPSGILTLNFPPPPKQYALPSVGVFSALVTFGTCRLGLGPVLRTQ